MFIMSALCTYSKTPEINLQDPQIPLNFFISGLVLVECTEALYYENPEI